MTRLPPAILFDLDDTIISAYGRPERAWAAVIAEFQTELGPLAATSVLSAVQDSAARFWADAERHRAWRQKLREARREVVRDAFAALSRQGTSVASLSTQNAIADRFTDYRDEQMHIFPDAHETIDALRARGVRLALITNGDGVGQRAKIERFDLAHRFHHIQIEGEHGFGKPEPRAYLHALERLDVGARDSWMVGDNLEWEVTVPQRLGIHAIWFDAHGAGLPEGSVVRPDRIVRKLSELLE